MIEQFGRFWEKNKGNLEKYFRTHTQDNYNSYQELVKLLFDIIINSEIHYSTKYDTDKILVIDDGDYQGTQIFILHKDTYQPDVEDYIYTNTYYGSCGGCDTLMSIYERNYYELPDDKQVKDYMTLCLHLLQRCCFMKDIEAVPKLEAKNDPQEELTWDEQDALRNIEIQLNDEHHLYIVAIHNDCEMKIIETAIKEFKENRNIK